MRSLANTQLAKPEDALKEFGLGLVALAVVGFIAGLTSEVSIFGAASILNIAGYLFLGGIIALGFSLLQPNRKQRYSSIQEAVRAGDVDTIRRWAKAGKDINVVDQDGSSLLHHAVYARQLKSVRALAANDAEINCSDREGTTPLMLAKKLNLGKIEEILLLFGADETESLAATADSKDANSDKKQLVL